MNLYNYNPEELTNQAKIKAGTSNTGLTKNDMGGIGLQLLGGYLQDVQAQKQLEEQQNIEQNIRDQQSRQTGIQRMIDAQRWQDTKNQQARQQGLEGLNFLSNMRSQSQQDARRRSFRDNLLKAGT